MALSATADANLDDTYRSVWHEVADENAGPYDGYAGRNLARYGVNLESGKVRDATRAELRAGLAVMGRMLNPPVAAPVAEATTSYGSSGTSWDAVAACESGGDWSISTGNGYFGGLQFDSTTWDAYGDPAYGEANEAPMEAQIAAAESMPYDGWPNC